MIKIAKELNNVIESLEDNGRYIEASELQDVFMKVAQFEAAIAGGLGAQLGTKLFGGGPANNVVQNNPNNFQKLIEEYKNRFVNELKTTNNATTPATSQFYNSVMQGSALSDQEKLAFRAQAYRIRTEVRNQIYGMGDTSKLGNRGNINLMVENVVNASGLYREKSLANVDRYFPLIMSSIEQQILQRINPNERPRYLESAKALVGTYINRQKAVLSNQQSAQRVPVVPSQ